MGACVGTMDFIFICTTVISIITNVTQYVLSRKWYNIVFLHVSLLPSIDVDDIKEYTDLSKAVRQSRHESVIFVGNNPSIFPFDWLILPEGYGTYSDDPRVVYTTESSKIKQLLD